MPTLHRLTRSTRAHECFNGEGARLYGGRWNSPGLRAVYTSGSRALCLLETLVHLDTSEPIPDYSLVSVEVAAEDIETLPPALAAELADIARTRPHGDHWLRQCRGLALAVPSVIVPEETNYVLNPAHPRFLSLRPGPPKPFVLDDRLFLDPRAKDPAKTPRSR